MTSYTASSEDGEGITFQGARWSFSLCELLPTLTVLSAYNKQADHGHGEGLACSAQPVSLLPEQPQMSSPCSLLVQGFRQEAILPDT